MAWNPFASLFERRSGAISSSHDLYQHLYGGRRTVSGVIVNEATAMQVAAVASCVRLLSGVVSTLPVDVLERRDERTRVPAVGHPLRRLLYRPNSWQTWADLCGMMTAHVLLRGNAYVLRVGSGGVTTELIPMHPDQVTVEQAAMPSMAVTYKWTSRHGRQFTFGQQDVLHWRGLSTDGLVGRSVLEDAREVFGVAFATQEHAASFWSGSGLPSVVLKHPKTLGPDGRKAVEDSFIATYGGGKDAKRVAVLEEGMELHTLSVTAEDAQFLETRKFQRGEIAGLFGVPPHLIGDTEKSTSWGTGIEQQNIALLMFTIGPMLVRIEQRMNADLLGGSDRYVFKFFTQGLMRGDAQARGAWYRIMREVGAYSANDIRRLEDEPPVDGGDTYLQPLNLAPLGSVSPQK